MRLEGTPFTYARVRLCGCDLRKGKGIDTAVKRTADKRGPGLTKRIGKVLTKHAKEVAPKIAKRYAALTKGNEDIIARLMELLDPQSMSEAIESELDYAIRQVFKIQAIIGITQLGLEVSADMVTQMDKAARAWAATRGGELMRDTADTTIEAMRAVFARAIDEGMSADNLESAVLDAGSFSLARAAMIARTELAFAHVSGNVAGWRETGQVDRKRWILGDNHDIDDVCDDAVDAGDVGLDEEFVDGIDFPPAHPNCVCDVLPILKESDTGD